MVKNKLHQEEQEVIVKALKHYQSLLTTTNDISIEHNNMIDDEMNNTVFDLHSLIGLFKKGTIKYKVDQKTIDTWVTHSNVDFPDHWKKEEVSIEEEKENNVFNDICARYINPNLDGTEQDTFDYKLWDKEYHYTELKFHKSLKWQRKIVKTIIEDQQKKGKEERIVASCVHHLMLNVIFSFTEIKNDFKENVVAYIHAYDEEEKKLKQ